MYPPATPCPPTWPQVLEYVPDTVYRINKHYTKNEQRMPLILVKLYVYQMLRALAHIHSLGVCHRCGWLGGRGGAGAGAAGSSAPRVEGAESGGLLQRAAFGAPLRAALHQS